MDLMNGPRIFDNSVESFSQGNNFFIKRAQSVFG